MSFMVLTLGLPPSRTTLPLALVQTRFGVKIAKWSKTKVQDRKRDCTNQVRPSSADHGDTATSGSESRRREKAQRLSRRRLKRTVYFSHPCEDETFPSLHLGLTGQPPSILSSQRSISYEIDLFFSDRCCREMIWSRLRSFWIVSKICS